MEYCKLGSVRDMIEECENTPLDANQIAFILRGALKGLTYLHARNIIHRDIKSGKFFPSKKVSPLYHQKKSKYFAGR